MVFIPFSDGYTPPEPPTYESEMVGMDLMRELTHWFILQDPSYVVLTPREQVDSGNGSFGWADLPPRPQQMVKLIFTAGNSDGAVESSDGIERKYDFVLVGEWNATVKLGDYWRDPETEQKYVVTGLSPYNGYEIKANVTSYGKDALYG